MTSFTPLHGQCQCGRVHFHVHGAARELYYCHCQMCRRMNGSLFSTFSVIDKPFFQLECGQDSLSSFTSPAGFDWFFCHNCGCQLYLTSADYPETVWYRPAVLDLGHDPGHPRETGKHIFMGSKSHLDRAEDDNPCYEEFVSVNW